MTERNGAGGNSPDQNWRANGRGPARQVPPHSDLAIISATVIAVLFSAIMLALLLLVGLGKMTVEELEDETKLLVWFFGVAVGGLVGTKAVSVIKSKELSQ